MKSPARAALAQQAREMVPLAWNDMTTVLALTRSDWGDGLVGLDINHIMAGLFQFAVQHG